MIHARPALGRSPHRRGGRARPVAACTLVASLAAMPVAARADCLALSPSFDGVLRLDTGRAPAAPCATPLRRYAAAPSGRSAAPAAPAKSAAEPGPPPGAGAFARLQEQTARLQDQLARLNDETAGLRAETRRLREELARREAGDAATALKEAPAGAGAGELPPPSTPNEDARAVPSVGAETAKAGGDQAEFERRKGVAERAWSELLDFAARMKKGLSGKSE